MDKEILTTSDVVDLLELDDYEPVMSGSDEEEILYEEGMKNSVD